MDTELRELPSHRPIHLQNVTCPYCGRELDQRSRTREHVIGRRFAPKAALNNQWNLIVWACEACNHLKSQLEDDISAITMLLAPGEDYAEDSGLRTSASHKARTSFSRRTGKLVGESHENLSLRGQLGPGIGVSFNMIAPPQIDSDRAFHLARLHAMAFFYFITFNQETGRGGFWIGQFLNILEAQRGDWGNAIFRGFMELTGDWDPRMVAIGADGFFKLAIRRNPAAEIWSLAVEWNASFRVVAAFGNRQALDAFSNALPVLDLQRFGGDHRSHIAGRTEIPLAEGDDSMFAASWLSSPE